MTEFDKAIDLYLRGYKGNYIKEQTGVSLQSLLKKLLLQNIKYSKDDISDYQYNYIINNYTVSDVENAYRFISKEYPDLSKAQAKREIIVLGCCFGSYAKVFKRILGPEKYDALRNECWKLKQVSTVREKYGVDNVFDKRVFSNFVSDEAIAEGRIKREQTLLERYGVTDINKYQPFIDKMVNSQRETFIQKYGVDNPMKVPEIASLSVERRQESMLELYGVANSVQSPEIMDKIFKSRRKNKTLNTSLPETTMLNELQLIFGEDDVVYNEIIDDRYPYHVDFYIKSRDLFIELNGDISHGNKWFDIDDDNDKKKLESYFVNMERIESESGKKSKYGAIIRTWTVTDVTKRSMAKENKLNYLVFWDGSCSIVKGERVAKLSDFYEWVSGGCQDSFDWNPKNTY